MIKFRAWDNEDEIYTHNEYYFELLHDGKELELVSTNKLIIEQFTGLKDVNSKEIYVGDIVQYSDQFYEYSMGGVTDRETGYIGSVVNNSGAFGILINRISYTDAHNDRYHAKDFVPFCEFDDPESDMALKGNVHDNPELLEADK